MRQNAAISVLFHLKRISDFSTGMIAAASVKHRSGGAPDNKNNVEDFIMAVENEKKKGTASDFIITSIGACIAEPEDKKKGPCVIIAYSTGGGKDGIKFTSIGLPPKNKLYSEKDIFGAVMAVEKVKNITYTDSEGRPKDIYFCRSASGRITDVLERDYEMRKYKGRVAEVLSSPLKFALDEELPLPIKHGKNINVNIISATDCSYPEGSYEYAIINAFNACLLGNVFDNQALRLETKSGRRVRIEIRTESSDIVEDAILYVRPVTDDGIVSGYVTEQFNYIDGTELSCRAYKITYKNRFNDYVLERV